MAEEFTAKFKVDISDLKQNINEANRQIKLANATFKAETAGMDKWSTTADGLSSRLKQLKTVLENQKSILQSYKGQLEAQKKAYDENGRRADMLRDKLKELADSGVSKTSDEYKKYQDALKKVTREQDGNGKAVDTLSLKVLEQEAAVKDTEKQIRHYDESLENLGQETTETTEKVEKSSDGFTVFKGVLADLASTAIQAVISGLKDMGAAAFDAWQEFDEGADNITKRTGATGEAAKALQDVYKAVSGRVVGDLGDIGDAVGEVNTRFGLQGKELEDLSTKFLKFAELNGGDVAGAIDDVQAAMAAFNLDASDAGDVLDILNKAAQDTGVPIDQLTKSLLTNGPALQEMGFGVNTAVGFLSKLEKNGIDTGTMLAGLRKGLQNATKDGKPLNEALQEMQKKMEGAASDTEAAQAAVELFGGKAGPAIAKAVQEGRISFDELSNTVQDFGNSVDSTFDATLDAPDQLNLALQQVKVSVGETIGEFLDQHAPQIEEALNNLTENVLPAATDALGGLLDAFSWFVDNGDAVIAALAGIAAGVAAYLAYQTALTVMNEGWKALTIVTKAQTIAQAALNAVMSANPIGVLIAVIMALVAAFTVLWNTNEGFRNAVINLWNAIKTNVMAAVETIRTGVINKFNQVRDKVTGIWNAVKSKTQAAWSAIKSAITKPINDAKTAVHNAVNSIRDKINNVRISFPKIKLPHFSVSGGEPPWGIMGMGSLPKISVSWYARGGVLNRPTLIGAGENGAEAVVPLEKNKYWIRSVARDMLDEVGQGGGGGGVLPAGSPQNVTYNQTINAPKQPSRIQLYRQTRNLLAQVSTGGGV